MAGRFSSLEQIASTFGLQTAAPDEVRDLLRRRRLELHPDRTGGQFESEEAREQFHLIEEALTAADTMATDSTALVPVEAITQIVRALREESLHGTRENREEALQSRLGAQVERSLGAFRSPVQPPTVVLSAITAVLTALWLFPKVAMEHPVLKQIIDVGSPAFGAVWMSLVMTASMGWVLSWRQKDRFERLHRALRTEAYQNHLFERFVADRSDSSPVAFTKQEFVDYIQGRPDRYYRPAIVRLPGGDTDIDPETAQSIAELVLLRLEKRGLVSVLPGKTLSPRYQIEIGSDESAV